MNKENIIEIVKNCVSELLGSATDNVFSPQSRLEDLGADSMDRAEIIINSMEKLNIRVPLTLFAKTKIIDEISEILYQTYNQQHGSQ